MKIGVIGAMIEEITPFKDSLKDMIEVEMFGNKFYTGTYAGHDIVLVLSGVGKVNAAITTTLLFEHFKPTKVFNIGTAGGVREELNVGDIVVSEDVCYHDVDATHFGYEYGKVPGMPSTFHSDIQLMDLVKKNESLLNHSVHYGLIATGDSFIGRTDQIDKIKENFEQVMAVEMEACAVAHTCYKYDVPFIIVRSISDVAGKESQISFGDYLELAAENSTLILKILLENIN
jgi:adenosylhomocysteine nucleosidase